MRVLLYGCLKDAIAGRLELDAKANESVAEVRRRLASMRPEAAAALARSRALIGGAVVPEQHALGPGDELEFLPPVSGG